MKFLRPLFLYASMLAVAAFTVPWANVIEAASYAASAMATPEPIAGILSDGQRAILAALFVLAAVVLIVALALFMRSTERLPGETWTSIWRMPLSPDRSPPD